MLKSEVKVGKGLRQVLFSPDTKTMDIKGLGYEVVSRLGLPYLQKRISREYIAIVMYHGIIKSPLSFYDWSFVEEKDFRAQIKYLKEHFEVIPLSAVKERIRSGVRKDKPAVAITFDDGYQNNYDVAFPVLCEAKVPATIFLTTDYVDTNQTIWPFKLHDAFSRTLKTWFEWDGDRFEIPGPKEKLKSLGVIKERLKRLPREKVFASVRDIVLRLGMDPDKGLEESSPYRILRSESIRSMQESGLVDFGAHTRSHSILSRLSREEQEKEIQGSIDSVKAVTGRNCALFAYPNGGEGDYEKETVAILQECGISAAVNTINGFNNSQSSMMELKRYGVGAGLSLANFKLMVHHVIAVAKLAFGWKRIQANGN